LFALLAAAFAFPSEGTAQGIAEGAFQDDALACFHELGAPEGTLAELREALSGIKASEGGLSVGQMRKEHSFLYLVLGQDTRIFPYEGAFLHVGEGRPGPPSLFLAPRTQDVKDWMRRCGALPENADTEPVDSVSNEFDFMRQLYTNRAQALLDGDSDAADAWQQEACAFRAEHIDTWVPQLMERTIDVTRSGVYAALARFALLSLTTIPVAVKD
jgi:TorA maturation chaperone TorD